MKTKFLIFSLLATFAMTNVFATEGNSEKQVAEEIHQQKVDQKVTPKSSNYRHSCISPWQYNHVIQRS